MTEAERRAAVMRGQRRLSLQSARLAQINPTRDAARYAREAASFNRGQARQRALVDRLFPRAATPVYGRSLRGS